MQQRFLHFVLVVAASLCLTQAASDYEAPHPHRGRLKPYEWGPFRTLKLTKDDEKILESGKPVTKQTQAGAGGGAICVQDVKAPKEAVWYQILDFNKYKGKVPKVVESNNYEFNKHRDGSSTIKTRMKLGVFPGYSYTSHYDHKFSPQKNSLTWRLDYDKTSDFDDVSGHWHLEDHPQKSDTTRVFYACDVLLDKRVPKTVVNYISSSALRTATGWVKKESEQNPTKTIPTPFLPKQ
eukprot:Nitzschia sp. Nitz4//scaffold25_size161228//96420//97244//NITZ4_002438-RA/size161228-augustus-gene-0.131-mRNA-1//-1//CDS//3329544610//2109//frame0